MAPPAVREDDPMPDFHLDPLRLASWVGEPSGGYFGLAGELRADLESAGFLVRHLRGERMSTEAACLDELNAVFQTDLSSRHWGQFLDLAIDAPLRVTKVGVACVISDPARMLIGEAELRGALAGMLREIARFHTGAAHGDSADPQESRRFHVVCIGEGGEDFARLVDPAATQLARGE